jgi:aryl-alcohol dehydrogenase-like predicted oxidoreductase
VKQGLTLYWGTSNWTAANVFEAFMICEKFNLEKPVAHQGEYNMIVRDSFEVDYARLFDKYHYGTTIYSPLLGGMLTGKYNEGIPENTRLDSHKESIFIAMKI